MIYKKIGHSDLLASVITLGAWSIGGGNWWNGSDDELSVKTIHAALNGGINLIDTAPIYGLGHSEEIIGKALKGCRDKVYISSKATFDWDTGVGRYCYDVDGHAVYVDHSYEGIRKDCENSLKRLQTDYIDIFYLHNPAKCTAESPVEESVRALMDLKKEGKIRTIGLSNVKAEHVEQYLAAGCELDILQRKYSLLERSVESEILPLCAKYGLSFHAYSPIERGLLTDDLKPEYVVAKGDARDGQYWWSPERYSAAYEFVEKLKTFKSRYPYPVHQLSIAYLLKQQPFIHVICGARKPEQILSDFGAAEIDLRREDVVAMRRMAETLEKRFSH